MQVGKNVQVVFCTVDTIQLARLLFNDAEDVIVKFVMIRFGQCRFVVFGREYNVIEDWFVGAHGDEVLVGIKY